MNPSTTAYAQRKGLIVEDQGLIAKNLQMILHKFGYDIAGLAQSGEEAIRIAEEVEPDFILMDIVLKGNVDGIEAANAIRRKRDVPVVFLTSYSDGQTLQRAKESSPSGYIVKPFEEQDIFVTLEVALHKHSLEKQIRAELERQVALRTQELTDSNRELEAFNYTISHDLRTPLRTISNYAGLLREELLSKLDTEELRYVDVILQSSRDMGGLLEGLLEFARIKRKELRKAPLNIELLARLVMDDLSRQQSLTKGVQFEVDANMPAAIGDEMLIRQVLTNFLANALKFTRTTVQPYVRVSFLRKDVGVDSAFNIYCITDNGVGFDMKYSGKLFGVFERLHGAEEFEGTGIGLSIVARIIKRHGGRVWAEGTPGEGATFYFTLPAV